MILVVVGIGGVYFFSQNPSQDCEIQNPSTEERNAITSITNTELKEESFDIEFGFAKIRTEIQSYGVQGNKDCPNSINVPMSINAVNGNVDYFYEKTGDNTYRAGFIYKGERYYAKEGINF